MQITDCWHLQVCCRDVPKTSTDNNGTTNCEPEVVICNTTTRN